MCCSQALCAFESVQNDPHHVTERWVHSLGGLEQGAAPECWFLRLLKKSTKYNYPRLCTAGRGLSAHHIHLGKALEARWGCSAWLLMDVLCCWIAMVERKIRENHAVFLSLVQSTLFRRQALRGGACSGSAGGEETIALSSEGFTVMQITHPITDTLLMPLTIHLLIKTQVAAFFYQSSALLLQGVNWASSR